MLLVKTKGYRDSISGRAATSRPLFDLEPVPIAARKWGQHPASQNETCRKLACHEGVRFDHVGESTIKKILIQLDSDSIVEQFRCHYCLLRRRRPVLLYGGVVPEEVRGIVYGMMFTRCVGDLKARPCLFGGSSVLRGEALLDAAKAGSSLRARVSHADLPAGNTTRRRHSSKNSLQRRCDGKKIAVTAIFFPVTSPLE